MLNMDLNQSSSSQFFW